MAIVGNFFLTNRQKESFLQQKYEGRSVDRCLIFNARPSQKEQKKMYVQRVSNRQYVLEFFPKWPQFSKFDIWVLNESQDQLALQIHKIEAALEYVQVNLCQINIFCDQSIQNMIYTNCSEFQNSSPVLKNSYKSWL